MRFELIKFPVSDIFCINSKLWLYPIVRWVQQQAAHDMESTVGLNCMLVVAYGHMCMVFSFYFFQILVLSINLV